MNKRTKAQSPYVKHGKTPYFYEFRNCKHSRSVYQSVPGKDDKPGFSGHVCATCNIITGNSDHDQAFRAEAA